MPRMAVVNAAPNANQFILNGARYLSAREIARTHGYVRDYIARLCRQGKVHGYRLGRLWYVNADSFTAFIARNREADSPQRII
jgi:hypothetical protein